MYLEIYQYSPSNSERVEYVQQEIRDFVNYHPNFEIVKTESILLNNIVTVHIWYKDINQQKKGD